MRILKQESETRRIVERKFGGSWIVARQGLYEVKDFLFGTRQEWRDLPRQFLYSYQCKSLDGYIDYFDYKEKTHNEEIGSRPQF
jgi:hypothetical protein